MRRLETALRILYEVTKQMEGQSEFEAFRWKLKFAGLQLFDYIKEQKDAHRQKNV